MKSLSQQITESFTKKAGLYYLKGSKFAKIGLEPESGPFKMTDKQREVLGTVFLIGAKGHEKEIQQAHFFDSGYQGISFSFNGTEHWLIYSQGTVGLEDQVSGSIYLAAKGGHSHPIFNVDASVGGGFGDTDIREKDVKDATDALKKFFNK